MAFPCLGILQVSTFVLTLNPKRNSFTHPHAISDVYDFLSSDQYKKQGALKRNDSVCLHDVYFNLLG